jgi:hypothetical protein
MSPQSGILPRQQYNALFFNITNLRALEVGPTWRARETLPSSARKEVPYVDHIRIQFSENEVGSGFPEMRPMREDHRSDS